MTTTWMATVKKLMKENPDLDLKAVLIKAKKVYRSEKGTPQDSKKKSKKGKKTRRKPKKGKGTRSKPKNGKKTRRTGRSRRRK
jgi:hypothetical protein